MGIRPAKASPAFASPAFECRPAGREAYRAWDLSSSHTPDTAEDSKPTAELPLLLRPVAALQPRISAAERSRSLYFRCKKQRKQLGAAEGDRFAKGHSGIAAGPHPAVPLPTRSAAKFDETDRGNLACCPDFKVSHSLPGDFVVAPVPDALPSLIVRRGDAPARRCGGVFE